MWSGRADISGYDEVPGSACVERGAGGDEICGKACGEDGKS